MTDHLLRAEQWPVKKESVAILEIQSQSCPSVLLKDATEIWRELQNWDTRDLRFLCCYTSLKL